MLLLLLAACWPRCGDYDLSGTTATDYEGHGYNDHWYEECGPNMGTSGDWNLFGDGNADVSFFPNAQGKRGWQGIDIEIGVSFPRDLLVSGTTIGLADLSGGADLNPCIDCRQDGAGLTDGQIRVLSGDDGADPCVGDGPTWKIAWDLTYGADGGPLYEVHGRDRILFMNFLSEDCASGY